MQFSNNLSCNGIARQVAEKIAQCNRALTNNGKAAIMQFHLFFDGITLGPLVFPWSRREKKTEVREREYQAKLSFFLQNHSVFQIYMAVREIASIEAPRSQLELFELSNLQLNTPDRISMAEANTVSFRFNNFIGTYCPKGVGHEQDSRSHTGCPPASVNSPMVNNEYTYPNFLKYNQAKLSFSLLQRHQRKLRFQLAFV